jgi:cation:H+ antiporter
VEFLLLIVGLTGLWWGTELTIRGAVSVARRLGLSEFVVGVAILSVGSDLPELTIAVDAGIRRLAGTETSDLVVGAALGSCLGQIGLVLGVAGLLAPLSLPRRTVLLHGGVMLVSLVALAAVGLDGFVTRAEGAALLAAYGAYLWFMLTDGNSYESPGEEDADLTALRAWMLVGVGLVIVGVGAECTVHGAIAVAEALGVDQAIVAIFLIGIGSSLPELSISVGAILRRRASLSVGNLIGSNIFDALIPAGAAALIAGIHFDSKLLRFDLVVLAVISAVVVAMLASGRGVRRPEAAVVLVLYAGYLVARLAGV